MLRTLSCFQFTTFNGDTLVHLQEEKGQLEVELMEANEKLESASSSASTEVCQELEDARSKLVHTQNSFEEAEKQRSSLSDELEGLSWKMGELSELQEELEETQQTLFKVQSENGALKKKLKETELKMEQVQQEADNVNTMHSKVSACHFNSYKVTTIDALGHF